VSPEIRCDGLEVGIYLNAWLGIKRSFSPFDRDPSQRMVSAIISARWKLENDRRATDSPGSARAEVEFPIEAGPTQGETSFERSAQSVSARWTWSGYRPR
jgi:hypothetical protein